MMVIFGCFQTRVLFCVQSKYRDSDYAALSLLSNAWRYHSSQAAYQMQPHCRSFTLHSEEETKIQ